MPDWNVYHEGGVWKISIRKRGDFTIASQSALVYEQAVDAGLEFMDRMGGHKGPLDELMRRCVISALKQV